MENAARQVRIYLSCGAAYFSLYTLILTFVPILATHNGTRPSAAGLLVLTVATSSFAADLFVAPIAGRVGLRGTIVLGTLILAAGCGLLFSRPHIGGTILACTVLGLGFSLTSTPILSGLATFASAGQVRTQSINAAWQRGGALVAAAFLIDAVSPGSIRAVIIAAVSLLAIILAIASLTGEAPTATDGTRPRGVPWHAIVTLIRTSPKMRLALLPSVTTAILIIGGSSFFPFYLMEIGEQHLLAPTLVAREAFALGALLLVVQVSSRRALGVLWVALVFTGTAGLALTTLNENAALLVASYALHGAAISAGIVLGNVLIFDATTTTNRTFGIAAGGAVNRLTAIVLPIALAASLEVSEGVMVQTIALLAATAAATYHTAARRMP